METIFRPRFVGNCFANLFLETFDFLSYELLAAKLNAYGLENSAVRLIFECLTNRKQ